MPRLFRARLPYHVKEAWNENASEKWAKRVRELRQIWSAEQTTTDREIQLALKIAHDCFPQLGRVDIASVLLSFKHRRYSGLIAPGECLFPSTIILLFVFTLLINLGQCNSDGREGPV